MEQNSSELRALLFACTMKKKERGEKQEKKQSTRSNLAGLIDFFTLDGRHSYVSLQTILCSVKKNIESVSIYLL